MAIGNRDEALRLLEVGYAERALMMVDLKVDPRFMELHSEPRFQDLLRRVNLSE